ncbi:inositol 1,4,5-trisphosphate receptor-interacting protein-like 2 [Egretta garzetta]|uniref:inositol 1,4,5-trisphosphate receptor-interacting protein-like 2 n=1 Tax=Egretta garzetta TaxID=188379 RepID=UPI00163CA472|nr:inositol 1,4,5-trisphosphate receptor-interacting protein-like 2 [Egretta garzetta]
MAPLPSQQQSPTTQPSPMRGYRNTQFYTKTPCSVLSQCGGGNTMPTERLRLRFGAGAGRPLSEAGGLSASRRDQRLLSWLKEQAPASSCHLKCLQILKGLRDLRGQGLEEPFCSQWGRVLSSYVLKTALFSLLLQGPLEAWDERFLVERLEDLVLYLRDCLRKQVLMHFFLGNASLPEAVALPRFLKEAAPVNLLAAFDSPTLDLAAFQLINTWIQAPHIIRMYSSPRYLRPALTPCRHIAEARQESPGE